MFVAGFAQQVHPAALPHAERLAAQAQVAALERDDDLGGVGPDFVEQEDVVGPQAVLHHQGGVEDAVAEQRRLAVLGPVAAAGLDGQQVEDATGRRLAVKRPQAARQAIRLVGGLH
ncbi:hypothetical protein D3C86_1804840 [compost metagenome]